MANSVGPDQTAPIGAVCSGSTLFASIINSSEMLGNCLQQTTSAASQHRRFCFIPRCLATNARTSLSMCTVAICILTIWK